MWMVPISICTSDDPTCAKMQILMDKPELTLVLKDVKPDQWVKVSCHNGREHIPSNKLDCRCNVPLHFNFLFSFFPCNLVFLVEGPFCVAVGYWLLSVMLA